MTPPPSEGEYLATWTGRTATLVGTGLTLAFAGYALFRLLTYDLSELEEWLPAQVLPHLRLGTCLFVLLFGGLLVLYGLRSLRSLTWDEQGFEFTPVWGSPQRFGWEEVVSLDLPNEKVSSSDRYNAILHLSGRRQITIDPEGAGYQALVAVMAAHHKSWDVVKERSDAREEPEWDGARELPEGVYRPPWWLLPSRLAVACPVAFLVYHLLCFALGATTNPDQRLPWFSWPTAREVAFLLSAVLLGVGIYLVLARTVRVLRWERDGFWLGRYLSAPRFHPWEELDSASQPSGTALGKTIVLLTTGEKAVIISSGHNYQALLAVLEKRGLR
jgi:hypothetical protein